MMRAAVIVAAFAAAPAAAQDPSKSLRADAVWVGEVKVRRGAAERTAPARLTVTQRDGAKFAGRVEFLSKEGPVSLLIEGSAQTNGFIEYRYVAVTKAPQEFRDGAGRNIVGEKMTGQIENGAVTLRGRQAPPDAKGAAPWQITLALKPKG